MAGTLCWRLLRASGNVRSISASLKWCRVRARSCSSDSCSTFHFTTRRIFLGTQITKQSSACQLNRRLRKINEKRFFLSRFDALSPESYPGSHGRQRRRGGAKSDSDSVHDHLRHDGYRSVYSPNNG